MAGEPLFHEYPQLSIDALLAGADEDAHASAVTDAATRPLTSARALNDQLQVGYGDHDLIPDDEDSFSRVVQLHSADKDYFAFRYADIVSTAMAGKFPAVWWIELFAGPGRLFVEPRAAYTEGSPVRAMQVRRPFDGYLFNDLDLRCVTALEPRVRVRQNVHVLSEDANSYALFESIARVVPRNALVTVYGDPAGLYLHFDTLARLAAHFSHVDLLLNFPVKGIIRALRGEAAAATTRAADVRKAAAVLGHPDPMSLIAAGTNRTWGPTIRQWFENRLRACRYQHFDTEVIELHGRHVPIYDLMIASRSARAVDFFREAIRKKPAGQYSLLG